jgi:hypothetical protein
MIDEDALFAAYHVGYLMGVLAAKTAAERIKIDENADKELASLITSSMNTLFGFIKKKAKE